MRLSLWGSRKPLTVVTTEHGLPRNLKACLGPVGRLLGAPVDSVAKPQMAAAKMLASSVSRVSSDRGSSSAWRRGSPAWWPIAASRGPTRQRSGSNGKVSRANLSPYPSSYPTLVRSDETDRSGRQTIEARLMYPWRLSFHVVTLTPLVCPSNE